MAFKPAPPAAALAGCLAQPVRSLWTLAGATHLPRLPCTRWAQHKHRCHSCALPLPLWSASAATASSNHPDSSAAPPRWTMPTLAKPHHTLQISGRPGVGAQSAGLMASHPEVRAVAGLRCLAAHAGLRTARACERGFDHSLLLARSLSEQYDRPLPLLSEAVQRQHLELPQHASSREQRLRQLRGIFSLAPARQALVKDGRFCCSTT
jgi:hypothetical protein